MEHARNVIEMADADSAENQTNSQHIVIWPLSCEVPNRASGEPKLVGSVGGIKLRERTRLRAIYGRDEIEEDFFCNYGLNGEYEPQFEMTGLVISARGDNGEVRAVEAPAHRFFLATLFQPQFSSTPERPHPVIVAFARAAAEFHRARTARRGGAR